MALQALDSVRPKQAVMVLLRCRFQLPAAKTQDHQRPPLPRRKWNFTGLSHRKNWNCQALSYRSHVFWWQAGLCKIL